MKIFVADAFTYTPYTGNPAAVCLLPCEKPDEWMQCIAAEMNLSETAFLIKLEDGSFSLRWFTPASEVSLCGHATLASAHILWEQQLTQETEIRFYTKSGLLTALRRGDRIELNFPVERDKPAEPPDVLAESINAAFAYVGRNRMDYIVEVKDQQTVASIQPDFEKLKSLETRGVIVTAKADDDGMDFVSRCFYPAIGINEDPVTGSAHCCLAPYWGNKLNKTIMSAKQLSLRGGGMEVELAGDRVLLRGHAVTTLYGTLAAE